METAFGAEGPEAGPHWPQLNWTRVLCPRRLPLCSPPPSSRALGLLPSRDSSARCLHPSLQKSSLQILITSALAGDECWLRRES